MDMLSYFLGRLAGGGTGGSGGVNDLIYTDLVYNDDGSITLTDDEGQEHIMECEYVDGRLEKVKIDGNILDAVYEEGTDKLIKLGDINIEVGDYPSEIGNIETLIDNSGVLDSTEGSVGNKVEQLIDKAYNHELFECITTGDGLFKGAKIFPSKAVVNLPNATTIYSIFASWDSDLIVEEITLNVPKLDVSSYIKAQYLFQNNHGVKKVILNLPDEFQYMYETFFGATNLEELVLNFSTKNIQYWRKTFWLCSTLKRIIGVFDFSSCTSTISMFHSCSALEEITFEPNSLSVSTDISASSKLTSESIQSIIDGLATVETAQTLTLNSAIILTDEQKVTINAKGWTLVQ